MQKEGNILGRGNLPRMCQQDHRNGYQP